MILFYQNYILFAIGMSYYNLFSYYIDPYISCFNLDDFYLKYNDFYINFIK